MKLGIAASTFQAKFGPIVLTGDDLAGNVKLAAQLGYSGLDLFMDTKSDSEIDEIGELLAANSMEVCMFIAIFLAEAGTNLSSSDERKRQEGVANFRAQIRVAERLRSRTMPIGFIRGNQGEDESSRAYQDRLARSMAEILEDAVPRGIDICLEPINRYEMSSILRVEEAVDFIEHYRLGELKILPDLFHMNIEEVSVTDALRAAGDWIGHVHIADSNRLAPGQGHLDYDAILSTLRSVGYEGYLSIEAFPRPDPETCARQGAEYMTPMLTTQT